MALCKCRRAGEKKNKKNTGEALHLSGSIADKAEQAPVVSL
jgi:hypothetical protein